MWRELYLQAICLALFFVIMGLFINLLPHLNLTVTDDEVVMIAMFMIAMLATPYIWLYKRAWQKYGLMHLLLVRVVLGTAMSVGFIIVLFRLASDALLILQEHGWNVPHSTIGFMSDGIMVSGMFALAAMIALMSVLVSAAFKQLNKKMGV